MGRLFPLGRLEFFGTMGEILTFSFRRRRFAIPRVVVVVGNDETSVIIEFEGIVVVVRPHVSVIIVVAVITGTMAAVVVGVAYVGGG